jgi:hypothetical protein
MGRKTSTPFEIECGSRGRYAPPGFCETCDAMRREAIVARRLPRRSTGHRAGARRAW